MTAQPTSESARDRGTATFPSPQRLQDVVASDPQQLRGSQSRGPDRRHEPVRQLVRVRPSEVEQGPVGEPHDELLTVSEAGEYLATGERFIRRLIAQRRISYVKLGKYVRLQRSALDAFIAAGRVPSD